MNLGAHSKTRENPAKPKGVKPTPRPASHRGKPVLQRRKNIQAIDLSHSGDQNGYTQHGHCDHRNLHRLHTDVNKGVSVPIIGANTPIFSYTAESQPQISFLNHSVSTSDPNGKPSSEYDDGWMDDFPSPSLLLDNQQSNSIRSSRCKFSSQAAEKTALDGDSTSIFADYDNPITTLNEKKRKTIDLEASRYAMDQMETSKPTLPELPTAVLGPGEVFQCVQSDYRLFCSADSPQQKTSPLEKRKLAAGPEVLQPKETLAIERHPRTVSARIFEYSSENDHPRAKKRKVNDSSSEQVLLLSIDGASQSQPSLKASRPSSEASEGLQSLRVEESDTAFVVEKAGFTGSL